MSEAGKKLRRKAIIDRCTLLTASSGREDTFRLFLRFIRITEFRVEGTKEILWTSCFPFGASNTQRETPPIFMQTVPSSPYIQAGGCQHYANHLHSLRRDFIKKDTREDSKLYLAEISRGPYLILRRRPWHPTPVFLPGKSHGWRSLVGCSPWGR